GGGGAAGLGAGPVRRWGTPNGRSTPAPPGTPAANAKTTSVGDERPVISCSAPASHRASQAVRRHERLSHGAAATTPATAAPRAGPASDGPMSHGQAPAGTAAGRSPPARLRIPIRTAPVSRAAPARLASSRNRRWRTVATIAARAAATKATCISPVSARPAVVENRAAVTVVALAPA